MNRLLTGDCRIVMPELIAQGVRANMVMTSPPYWRLRDYGMPGQIGLEPTREEYIETVVGVFRQVRELLHDDGTVWLNIGDRYANEDKWGGASGEKNVGAAKAGVRGKNLSGLKDKDMCLIPQRLAIALQDDGWWVRRDIIWEKPNATPESCEDRPSTSHEYVWLLAKREHYYYDHEAIKEPQEESERRRRLLELERGLDSRYELMRDLPHGQHAPSASGALRSVRARQELAVRGTRNKRSVWTIPSRAFDFEAGEEHFAVYPPELVEPCVLAGTSARGHCPRCGAGWKRIMDEPIAVDGRASGNKERKFRRDFGGVGEDVHSGHQGFGVPWSPKAPQTLGWLPSCKCHKRAKCADACLLEPVPGVVFDPFGGSGTTAEVATKLGRQYLSIELNPKHERTQRRRTSQPGLALA